MTQKVTSMLESFNKDFSILDFFNNVTPTIFFQAQHKISQTRTNENQEKAKKLVAYERKTTKTNE